MDDPDRFQQRAHSFGEVADEYDRARPAYPPEAAAWLIGSGRLQLVELGAGTGKLTKVLVEAGHDVLATDPSSEMLAHLRSEVPLARACVGVGEQIPAPSRSFDVVVCAQSFHWLDTAVALPEIARILRPGGRLALVWNVRDESIPWVRRLGRIIASADAASPDVAEMTAPVHDSAHFGVLDHQQFRFWHTHTRASLMDLAKSRSAVAVLPESARERLLAEVGALYDEYGRGPDGMQLPYLTHCYRAVVRHQQPIKPLSATPARAPQVTDQQTPDGEATEQIPRPAIPEQSGPPEDPGTTLIDFN